MLKKVVYFNEFNLRRGNVTYFPLVSGILRAYAETSITVKECYKFKPFNFYFDSPENVLALYDEAPDVAAFSVAMWNEQLNLVVAGEIKKRWPECQIIFGGAQVPHLPEEYLERYPFIDICVRAEGENAFLEILERFVDIRDFSGIPNVSYRDLKSGAFVYNPESPEFVRDLDDYPSPYTENLFTYMFDAYPNMEFQAIIETNRGCPFLCTFCFWGRGGTTRKYRYHGLDRVREEIEWVGLHKIRYLFNADSNFGMHKRDSEIAEFLVETKQKYGYPDKFRTCWGKNTDVNIFQIAANLHKHNMDKGVTLARQTNSKTVLGNIKRGNIKMDTYSNLQRLFNDAGIPVYSEMILGLPGETYVSWRDGIEEQIEAGPKNQLYVYQCEVYCNTELADPEYQEKFGIKTKRIELNEVHGGIRSGDWIPEYQDIIVETASMPVADWRRMTRFSIMAKVMYSMQLGLFALSYLADRYGIKYTAFIEHLCDLEMANGKGSILRGEVEFFDRFIDDLLKGKGIGVKMPEFGSLYWDIEETTLLRSFSRTDEFYEQFFELICDFINDQGHELNVEEISEVIRYQRLRMPDLGFSTAMEVEFEFNIPEYFDRLFGSNAVTVSRDRQVLSLNSKKFDWNQEKIAREVILWGRNSGTMLVKCDWQSLDRPWCNSTTLEKQSVVLDIESLPRAANLGRDKT